MTKVIAFIALFAAMTTSAVATKYRCDPNEKYFCDIGAGCRPVPTTVWNLIDTEKRTFSRCDQNECNHYEASFHTSGTFINIDVRGRSLIAKMALDGSSFVEVATLMTQVYTSFGACRVLGR